MVSDSRNSVGSSISMPSMVAAKTLAQSRGRLMIVMPGLARVLERAVILFIIIIIYLPFFSSSFSFAEGKKKKSKYYGLNCKLHHLNLGSFIFIFIF